MRERIKFVDQLKGVAIFLVVIGHLIQYNTIEGTDNKIFNFIYSFHMPLFMFLSGFIAYHTIKIKIFEKYGHFLAKKARTLLIPFFSWPLLVDALFFRKASEFDFIGQTQQLLNDPRTGLWFLWYLFFLTIIYSLFVGISARLNAKDIFFYDLLLCFTILIFVVSLRMTSITYIDSFLQYYLYFFLGVFFSKYIWIQRIVENNNISSVLVIAFLLTIGFYSFVDAHNDPVNMIIKLLCAITGTFTFYNIATKIEWGDSIDKFVSGCGTSSLAIYATHSNFVHILSNFAPLPPMSITMLIILCIPTALIIILICRLIQRVVVLFPILNFLLYGGSLKNKSNRT